MRCRYADFRAFGRYAGGFAPQPVRDHRREWARRLQRRGDPSLPHGNAGRRHQGQQLFGNLVTELVAARDPASPVPIRKPAALGVMFHTKMELWQQYTRACQAALERSS